jgi:hypothetical protein
VTQEHVTLKLIDGEALTLTVYNDSYTLEDSLEIPVKIN